MLKVTSKSSITFFFLSCFLLPNQIKSASRCIPHTSGQEEGTQVLRHPAPHFLPNSGGIACLVATSTPRLTLTPERRNGNINLSKYFISSSGDRTHNLSVLQSHFVPLRHDRPHIRLSSKYFFVITSPFLISLPIQYFSGYLTLLMSGTANAF